MTRLAHDWFPRALPENVVLGEQSYLYSSFAFLHCRSTQSVAVRMGRSSAMYGGFFDLGPEGQVEIGEFSSIVQVTIATNGTVRIGRYCFIAHRVMMGDHEFAMPAVPDPTRTAEAASSAIVLEDDVWIGMGAVLLGGAHIGAGSIIGAEAVVNFTVPPDVVVAGNPARIVRSLVRT